MLGRAVPCPCRRAACGKSTCSCGGGAGHRHLGINQAGSRGGEALTLHSDDLLCLRCLHAGDGGRTGRWLCQHRRCTHGMVPRHRRGRQQAQLHPAGHRGAGRGSAARSCHGCAQQPAWVGEAQGSCGSAPGPGPLQLPRPLGWCVRHWGDGVCARSHVCPHAAPAGACRQQAGQGPTPAGGICRIGPRAICSDRSGW